MQILKQSVHESTVERNREHTPAEEVGFRIFNAVKAMLTISGKF
jgi:hypothetical protein